MTDQLEQELRASLGRRADAPVDTIALAAVAMRKGRRLRGWTYAARCAAAAVAVGAVVAAVALLPGRGPGITTAGPPSDRPSWSASNQPSWSASGPPSWSASGAPWSASGAPAVGGTESPWVDGDAPALPVAAGVAGAAADPGAVGADPAVLHFGLDATVARAATVAWGTGGGTESVDLVRADSAKYVAGLARDVAGLDRMRDEETTPPPDWAHGTESAMTVAGRPAVLRVAGGHFTLRWQPVDGLWAQVYGGPRTEPQTGVAIGAGLRLGTAYRCVSPMHLAKVPAGMRLTGCGLALDGYDRNDSTGRPTRLSQSWFQVGDGTRSVEITLATAIPAGPMPSGPPKNPVRVPIDGYWVQLFGDGYDAQALTPIWKGLTIRGDMRAPATWPERLIG
ncbi:hypothetical protein [Dactylosporangium sp. NPDC048998]|uniref:hypothetical protein n=1 Tax=Dactylosporangium sp. NPDC048998 TaxID=3363976 RepID=UPI00371B3021